MSRRLALKALAAVVLTIPLGGCPLAMDALGGPPVLTGGKFANVRTNLDPEKKNVAAGEVVTLWVTTNLDGGGLAYQWSATGGQLSSTSGQTVQWTAGGSGNVRVTCVISSGEDSTRAEYLFTVR
jgi:hypothetical protein